MRERLVTFLKTLSPFVRRHVEMVVWLPALTVLLVLGWYVTWQSGIAAIEVGPIVMDFVVTAAGVIVLLWLTWLAKKAYWGDLNDEEEKELEATLNTGDLGPSASGDRLRQDKRNAWLRLIADRAQFVLMFVLVLLAKSAWGAPATTCARDLVIRWEVTSPQVYERRYQRPVWPAGASGVTWGVGYDGGHQPRAVILQDWAAHPHAARLATTSGVTGTAARDILPQYRDIVVGWAMAVDVLDRRMLPRYERLARQAYGPRFDAAPPCVRGALTSETLNRGPGMVGDRRRERRVIRDVCLPMTTGDDVARCVAQQLTTSCRVWANDPVNGVGLCNRRKDEARVARL